ncbi:MAG: SLC13 family permease [Thermus sp.]|uniref:SLC13 family permease n=1 Tax=Thermus sp. TaxID=275 RepID=UPI0025E369D0|nr:SLC13 family permease [Thermus sp.]MCS6869198.1 SLC13 family permease [Thermus sp.]MCS7217383.1 SLC13 family permease [Thermus sp.]MDW8017744.1 SLC13 family permease [Thermus sp.]MDW8357488.1 SLC13 family permease [Thermus sp.]
MAQEALSLLVLSLTYLGLALGGLPGYRMNRAGVALVGASFLLLLGTLDLEAAWQALDAKTLVFLFGVMVLNAHLAYAGFFGLAAERLLGLARTPLALLVLLTLGAGGLSALFLNDTMALLLTPLVLALTRGLGLNPVPYLLALMGAVNTGSLLTPTGNPQNILVASLSGLAYLDFVRALWLPALLGLLLQVALLAFLYPEVRSRKPLPPLPPLRYRLHRPLLRKGLGVAVGLLLAFLLGYPLAQGALVGAGLLLFTRRLRSERYFLRVDWELLVLFGGLFVVTEGVRRLGLAEALLPLGESPLGLLLAATLLSLLISNVPAVLLLAPLVNDPRDWLLLAGGSTLAGNLTLLASVANLIVAEGARKEGLGVGLGEHLRFGLPLTLLTLALLYGLL